ncbi:MAG: hypothetical protein JSW02_00215 [candidate division WOR-3 bacterium]|nr:MAG: hypothetical protein JSW02_00215 [candidate division WOR-3 bacterium]
MFIIALVAAFESMLFPRSIILEEYYNPAVPSSGRFAFQFGTRSHFGIPGLRTYSGHVSVSRFHIGMQSFGDDLYRENMLTAGGCFSTAYGMSLGGELVLYQQSVFESEDQSTYSAHLGAHFQSTIFFAGAWVRNLTVPRLSSIDYIPPCYSMNVMYQPEQFLTVRCAVSSIELSMPFFSFGATYAPYHAVMFGIGVNSDPLYIDCSATFIVGAISIQYSGTNHQYLGLSHLFLITFFQ